MAEHIRLMEKLSVEFLHVDIMDGNYVPRLGIYPEIVERIAEISDLKLDVHLMVDDPEMVIDALPDGKIENISIHPEKIHGNIVRVIDKIRSIGAKTSIAINLSLDTELYLRLFEDGEVDNIMFMGIHPGVLKQKHRPESVMGECRRFLQSLNGRHDPELVICDGGVNATTIPRLSEAGINTFVCGTSTLYKGVSFANDFETQKALIEQNVADVRTLMG